MYRLSTDNSACPLLHIYKRLSERIGNQLLHSISVCHDGDIIVHLERRAVIGVGRDSDRDRVRARSQRRQQQPVTIRHLRRVSPCRIWKSKELQYVPFGQSDAEAAGRVCAILGEVTDRLPINGYLQAVDAGRGGRGAGLQHAHLAANSGIGGPAIANGCPKDPLINRNEDGLSGGNGQRAVDRASSKSAAEKPNRAALPLTGVGSRGVEDRIDGGGNTQPPLPPGRSPLAVSLAVGSIGSRVGWNDHRVAKGC